MAYQYPFLPPFFLGFFIAESFIILPFGIRCIPCFMSPPVWSGGDATRDTSPDRYLVVFVIPATFRDFLPSLSVTMFFRTSPIARS